MDRTAALNEAIDNIRCRCAISGAVLKRLAILSMLVDHTAAILVRRYVSMAGSQMTPQQREFWKSVYYYMRRFGRLAFPIFCFLLIEGFLHTRDVKKYASRLFLFALISEYPFDFALHHAQPLMTKQNVFFTLLIGLLVLIGIRVFRGIIPIQLMIMVVGMIFARELRTDYNYHGVFLIELLYITRFSRFWQSGCGAAYMQYYEKMPTPLAFIPIYLYNGTRGRQIKYFFYFFYPAHLLILGVLAYYMLPQFM